GDGVDGPLHARESPHGPLGGRTYREPVAIGRYGLDQVRLTRSARRGEIAQRLSARLDRRDGAMTVAGVGESAGAHDPREPLAAGCDEARALDREPGARAGSEPGLDRAGPRDERVIGVGQSWERRKKSGDESGYERPQWDLRRWGG